MTIAIVATSAVSLWNFRGPLIRRWVDSGHRVVAISIESPKDVTDKVATLGAEYVQVSGSRTGIGIGEGLRMIKAYKKAFHSINPDMVYLYMSKPVAFGGPAAIACGIKHINILVNGLENAYYRKSLKDWLVRQVMSACYKYVGNHSDNVFMQNSDDFAYFQQHHIAKPPRLSIVNGSGVDMEHFKLVPLPDAPVFLMTARLLWSKGIREYLGATRIVKKRYPYSRFILVGGFDHNDESLTEEELRQAINDCDIEYCGYTDDVRPYIEAASVYVLPSYHEGTPRSVLEAMSMGRAIITTAAPGCRETVESGVNGYLVPVGDIDSLADAMCRLVESADLRASMGIASHRICREKFEVGRVNEFLCSRMNV